MAGFPQAEVKGLSWIWLSAPMAMPEPCSTISSGGGVAPAGGASSR